MGPDLVLVAATAEGAGSVESFKASYGITDLEFWLDGDKNYRSLIPPGGLPYPIEVVIDRSGTVVYTANDYYPGEAIAAAQKAL
jgi:hypothetical protein